LKDDDDDAVVITWQRALAHVMSTA